ncbi:M43 family zinc metalloprotease [Oceanihabitans sp. 2_MG-2023]|uniref:M43 family zinc metalloprotease n=1 Tax=Oceanihabitans sp. 2_MG-2023 TaxID=3062661 RepID=UPI0026E24A43|nr:M43 family zinc metalloprotease [Oceanihabitans sp. 2_MG-2023]MDO6596502.1 M43 family zinc metalloprotease [Oceanihabitans sp. 2_MG-2023]
MKKITFKLFVLFLTFQVTVTGYAQEKSKSTASNRSSQVFDPTPETLESLSQTGFARCLTVENEALLKQKYPERLSTEEFEAWLAPKILETKANRATNRTVYNIPVVIHIIHDGDALGTGENITDAQAMSQITVMNEDYRKLTGTRGGANTTGLAVDTEINFCMAVQDENGVATTGIVRHVITPYSNNVTDGFLSGPDWETTADVEIMKANTQWDPTKYLNMWVIRPGGLSLQNGGLNGLLGYAQFPSNSGLAGLNTSGGGADTDGVVAGYNAMGTIDLDDGSFILNAQYNLGRTMTHEVGHWLGLRHIWGDGGCTADDYCDDTPASDSANYDCAAVTSCGSADQYQNYMDYSYDYCMDTFTQDQMDRIQTVMSVSPRRMELNSSNACAPAQIEDLDGQIEIENLNVANCSDYSITPELTITNKGNITLTSATINYNLDSGTNTTINWTGSLDLNESEIIYVPQITAAIGTHVFNVTLSNPNGATDDQLGNNSDSGNFTITGSACASSGDATDNYLTSTTGVTFNTIDNLNNNPFGDVGYSDFTNLSTNVNRESDYDLSVYYNPDGNYQTITYVWIDWNQNCSFDDPGEQYNLGTNPGDTTLTSLLSANSPLTVTIPNEALLGNTTMRVTTKYTDPDENQFPTSCEIGLDGEVEDYTINVLTSLSIDEYALNSISLYPNPTTNTLNISLSNNDLPDGYKIHNMLGQVIMNNTVSSNADLSINTSALSNGMYFIQIAKEGNTISLPFIKK